MNDVDKRIDKLLRRAYESGELTAEEFLDKLFASKEADRTRRKIVNENKKSVKQLQNA